MAGPTTEALGVEIREIREGFARTDVALAEVRTEVRILGGITKALVGVFGTLMFTSLCTGIWWAATLTARVGHLEVRLDQVDARFDKVDARFDKVDARFDKVQERFDQVNERLGRIEASIAKLLAKP